MSFACNMWHLHFPSMLIVFRGKEQEKVQLLSESFVFSSFCPARSRAFCFAIWDHLDVHSRTDFCDFLNQLIFMVAVLQLFDCNSCRISEAWMSYMRSLIILQKTKQKLNWWAFSLFQMKHSDQCLVERGHLHKGWIAPWQTWSWHDAQCLYWSRSWYSCSRGVPVCWLVHTMETLRTHVYKCVS